ncbi:MAG: M4 family metallopeptidase, partial [Thermoplasmata archaeon]
QWSKIQEPNAILRHVFEEFGILFRPENRQLDYVELETIQRKDGEFRARAYQTYQGFPIYGASITVFANTTRGVYRILNSFWRDIVIEGEDRVNEEKLQQILHERLENDPIYDNKIRELFRERKISELEKFPIISKPEKYLYPISRVFHYAYNLWAYQPITWVGVDGKSHRIIDRVELMLNAETGEIIWEEPAREGLAYTDTNGDGLSTLQDDVNNYLVRQLRVVDEAGGDYLLINRDNTPHIITHDAGGTSTNLINKLKNDSDISTDSDNHWNQTTTSCQEAQREASQQPEVDGHFYAAQAFNFYNNLGWVGFDNGGWGTHCPIRIVAHLGLYANAFFDKYSEWDAALGMNKYYGYLGFYDGKCEAGSVTFDFIAGDPVIFGHEYQHAITFFGAVKQNDAPGYLYGNNPWTGAIREGLSDTFGCLRRGLWISPPFWKDGCLRSGQPFRRIEYPRSTNTNSGDWYCDHYDDCDGTKNKYFHSTLISHVAYLVGQGGVHQRVGRKPELIPVIGGYSEETAEIFFYALTELFKNISLSLDEETFIEVSNHLLDAADDLPGGTRSCVYAMMRRALYAVGLYPYDAAYNKLTYGGEVCMIPQTYKWRFSQPYLGFPPDQYKSPDLFINNNGNQEYNVKIDRENKLFARVRNIGDQVVNDIRVRFYYRLYGTNLPPNAMQWTACEDSAGNDCILDIPSIPAGEMNFTDADNPPGDQSVSWYIDPALVMEGLDHFGVRAEIEFTGVAPPNNDNDCTNAVDSNISYEVIDERRCSLLGILTALLLAIFLVRIGTMPGGIQPSVDLPIYVLFIAVLIYWRRECRPNECKLLTVAIIGFGLGALILLLIALQGGYTQQLLIVLVVSIIMAVAAALQAWRRNCFPLTW